MIFIHAKDIASPSDIENLTDNYKVSVIGKVIKETRFGSSTLLTLDNNLEVLCHCKKSYKNRPVRIEGRIDSFTGKKRIIASKIENDN
jgi:hypothetical protein